MYLTDLLEDESKQQGGQKLYPRPDRDDVYILVRRAGTVAHARFRARLSRKYPPDELLTYEQREEKALSMLQEEVRDFLVVDMVGYLDEDGEKIKYQEKKQFIFSGDKGLGLINQVYSFANQSRNWTVTKNKDIKQKIEKFIKVNILEDADNDDWLSVFEDFGADFYEQKRGELEPYQMAILNAFIDAKRECPDSSMTRKQAANAALLVDYDFDEALDLIIHIDKFYNSESLKKLKARANEQRQNN